MVLSIAIDKVFRSFLCFRWRSATQQCRTLIVQSAGIVCGMSKERQEVIFRVLT